MSAKHTHGKLIVRPDGGGWSASHEGNGSTAYMGIVNDHGTTIALAVAHSTDPWNEPEGPDEDARRLVACWNACQGIETEELEIIDDAGENFIVVCARLKAQRDDLLAAAQDALSVCASVSISRDRRINRDGVVLYAQTEEWCRWAEDEVGKKLRAAIKAAGGEA